MTNHVQRKENSSPRFPDYGFIDLHAHLLPGMDDGAADWDEARQMLELAVAGGIRRLVVTPHVHSAFCRFNRETELADKKSEFIRFLAGVEKKPDVLFGAEVHLTAELPDLVREWRELLTINNSNYILVEFPGDFIFPNSRDLLYRLMLDGLIPLIAHPERNEVIQRRPAELRPFIEMGCLAQANAGSFTGDFGQEAQAAAFFLLKHAMVHVIASDAHDVQLRPPRLDGAWRRLQELGSERCELLFRAAPVAILANEPVPEMGAGGDPRDTSGFWSKIIRWHR